MNFKLSQLKLGTQVQIALVIFLLALVTANLLSLKSLFSSRTQFEQSERRNFADSALALSQTIGRLSNRPDARALRETMALTQTEASVGLYDNQGVLEGKASLSGDLGANSLLPDHAQATSHSLPTLSSTEAATHIISIGEKTYWMAEMPIFSHPVNALTPLTPAGYLVLVAAKTPRFTAENYFVFAFQASSVLLCVLFVFFFSRWLIYPYNRIAGILQSSSLVIQNAVDNNDRQKLIGSFEAAIAELRSKESELERLHSEEHQRAQSYERLSAGIVTSMPSGLVAIDPLGRLIIANEQAYRSLELTPQPSDVDEHGYSIFFERCPTILERVAECLKTGRTFRREEVAAVLPGLGVRTFEASITPLGRGYQDIQGALCLFADVTEINALREQMHLHENLATLGEMAAGIAHEFKNSLATIQGFAQLIESSGSDLPQHNEVATALIDETRNLTQMVTDFLRFARPDQIEPQPVDLADLLHDCLEESSTLLAATEVSVSMTGEPPEVSGDSMMLRHAFLNLLRNAIEAMDGAKVRELTIKCSAAKDAAGRRCAQIEIADTGSGIEPEILPKIFIPFFSTKSRGSGIGLAIVQKTFLGHGGGIEVTSVAGTGTTFVCRLPITYQSVATQTAASQSSQV